MAYTGKKLDTKLYDVYTKGEVDAMPKTQGMIHGFDVNPSTGMLTWTAGVTELYDGNFEPLNDSVIVGTDDMTFSVDTNGHLIMTIG